MDILIKSFNRPYYLDRCLCSIEEYGQNFKGQICILDDGTPQKYLDKIILKYPYVEILKSEFYEEKANAIETFQTDIIRKIPIDLWVSGAKNASNHFLLLEDDFWFIKNFDFDFYENITLGNNIGILKLIWLGNEKLISGKTIHSEKNYTIYKPDVYTLNPILFKILFNLNRFGFNKVMQFFKLYSYDEYLKYYSMYAVAGAVFNKKYFLSLWDKHDNEVDERLQLSNAVKFVSTNKTINFARTKHQCLKTGFSSSATNKEENPIQFDMFRFNQLMNEAWLKDEFITVNDLQNDLTEEAICAILGSEETLNKMNEGDWKKWVLHFKNQFRKIGCKID